MIALSPAEQTARQDLIERLARRAAELHLTAPAILFLETYKPLAYLGAQFVWLTEPFLMIWFKPTDLREAARLFEDRAAVEVLIERMEALQTAAARTRF